MDIILLIPLALLVATIVIVVAVVGSTFRVRRLTQEIELLRRRIERLEFDASRRAFAVLSSSGIVAADEMPGVRKTLYAAGFTYIAGALTAIATLVYYILQTGVLGGNREE